MKQKILPAMLAAALLWNAALPMYPYCAAAADEYEEAYEEESDCDEPDPGYYDDENPYLYEVIEDNAIRIVRYRSRQPVVRIPAEIDGLPVTSIQSGAFSENAVKVIVPESVTEIQPLAFAYSEDLRVLYLPDGMTEIPQELCYESTALETVYIPARVDVIGSAAFMRCTALRSVQLPEGVSRIGANAFNGCSSLETVALPETLEEIGKGAFRFCGMLYAVNLPDSLQVIGMGAFQKCTALESVTIPPQVTQLETLIFTLCPSLKTAVIPPTVQQIDKKTSEPQNNLTIYGAAGSAAEKYAAVNKIAFQPTEALPQAPATAELAAACDLNGDGAVTAADAVLLSRYAAEDPELGAAAAAAIAAAPADLNGDGILSTADVVLLIGSALTA